MIKHGTIEIPEPSDRDTVDLWFNVLATAFGEEAAGRYMLMNFSDNQRVAHFKHVRTRRYLAIDGAGRVQR